MRLTDVQVQLFRNIVDSTRVDIDPGVTCLVGKNESGKSTFLHALYRLNPARPNVRFSVGEHYPAWREKKDRLRGRLDEATPVTATFTLDDRDLAVLEPRFGADALRSPRLTVTRSYSGTSVFNPEINEAAIVATMVRLAAIPAAAQTRAAAATTLSELQDISRDFVRSGDTGLVRAAAAIDARVGAALGDAVSLRQAVRDLLAPRLPKFFFFDEYATLTGRLAIRRLLTARPEELNDEELTGLSLLTLAGADTDDLLNAGYERRRREMEGVANTLTEDALKYWSQNTGLRVLIDLTEASADHELHIRLWDARHYLSLPFDQRSSGFRWFFSFLAAFAPYEWAQEPMVILLDEPALGLHARAQHDFLRFINERLAVNGHQVIYSTHSPFMVEPDRLARVRVVEDRGRDVGSVVTADLASADPGTLYPLQGALGASLAHDIFGTRPVLLVDSLSTSALLSVLSTLVERRGGRHGQAGQGLDARWLVLPSAGAQQLATMVALSGAAPRAAVLASAGGDTGVAPLADAAARGALKGLPLITFGAVDGAPSAAATLEDLCEPGDLAALRTMIEKPADQSVQSSAPAPELSDATVSRLADLFRRVNALLA